MPDHADESIADFRERAVVWMLSHLPSTDEPRVTDRVLQQLLYDHRFAGIAFPKEYGGGGLTLEHQRAFYDEAARHQRQVPTSSALMVSIGTLGPTILDHGSHEAKLRFLPPGMRVGSHQGQWGALSKLQFSKS